MKVKKLFSFAGVAAGFVVVVVGVVGLVVGLVVTFFAFSISAKRAASFFAASISLRITAAIALLRSSALFFFAVSCLFSSFSWDLSWPTILAFSSFCFDNSATWLLWFFNATFLFSFLAICCFCL